MIFSLNKFYGLHEFTHKLQRFTQRFTRVFKTAYTVYTVLGRFFMVFVALIVFAARA